MSSHRVEMTRPQWYCCAEKWLGTHWEKHGLVWNAGAVLDTVAGGSYLTALLGKFSFEEKFQHHISVAAQHHTAISQISNTISYPLDWQKCFNLTKPRACEAVDEYVHCLQERNFIKHFGNVVKIIKTYCIALASQRNLFIRRHIQKFSQKHCL